MNEKKFVIVFGRDPLPDAGRTVEQRLRLALKDLRRRFGLIVVRMEETS